MLNLLLIAMSLKGDKIKTAESRKQDVQYRQNGLYNKSEYQHLNEYQNLSL